MFDLETRGQMTNKGQNICIIVTSDDTPSTYGVGQLHFFSQLQ